MTPTPLPDSPNLEQLKKQAKSLLADARARDRAALTRFAALPAFASTPIGQIDVDELALHDAQSVIAREHGFVSWNALREEVEARTLSPADAVDEFVRAATGGAAGRAERLLALHPSIATATLHTALVLGHVSEVEARLRANPALAATAGGPQAWEPLLYVCHTCLGRGHQSRMDGLLAIARQLLSLGANPNAEYHWNWHPELPRTALWAALITMHHIPLATTLLEAGAQATDGVTAHIAAGSGNIEALELLDRFGFDANGIRGGVPPLVYVLGYSEDPSGPAWLLDHGADPNLPWGPDNEAPLHVAARRWDVAMVERLVARGADLSRRRADGYTAHALAELHGNRGIAAWLLAHGAVDELSPLEHFIAAAARGDRPAVDAALRDRPELQHTLTPAHHLMLQRPAETGNAAVLETMLHAGFDPSVKDKDGVTALHRAAMAGHPQAVATLLTFGAPIDALDGMFSATPLVWAVEGRTHPAPGSDHVAAARVLIDHGSPLEWHVPPGAPNPERTLDGLRQLRKDAARR
jgi:ankyrin repeat protein